MKCDDWLTVTWVELLAELWLKACADAELELELKLLNFPKFPNFPKLPRSPAIAAAGAKASAAAARSTARVPVFMDPP
ncbi:MAG: hypothetical protein M3M95_02660 [Pseudomonadota bacterium]|nr:hypothetical protein [Pseudomonadota bacterium]